MRQYMRVWLVIVVGVLLVTSFGLGGWAARHMQTVPVLGQPGKSTGGIPDTRHKKAQHSPGIASGSLKGYDPRILPNFTAFKTVSERKRAFINFLLPLIDQANQNILAERREFLELKAKSTLTPVERERLHALARKYRVLFEPENPAFWEELLERVDTLPPSLILAQAAIESAWGTSRFAIQGNNLFGMWCFSPGCGLKPLAREDDKSHEVRCYDSVLASIEDYLLNLNRHSRYAALRDQRKELRAANQPLSGLSLVQGLHGYSETGGTYIDTVASVIRHNRLERFDKADSLVAAGKDANQG
ncbi:MAG: hypothetical protein D6758_08720 [Gammaproteobacteria bacterium]|nr:MAG: hypothetical protein D6758_08720 [Gammaproteobacteria bacterium]